MNNFKNCIYILTNPLYAGYVKIGYASDLTSRLASLNTGMLRNFEPYAVYETPTKNADKQFHAIIDDLAPIVRARVINGQKIQDKEFFKLEPEQTYDILQHVATMTGTESRLHKIKEETVQTMPNVSPYIQQPKVQNTKTPTAYYIGNESFSFVSYIETLKKQCEIIITKIGFSKFKSDVLGMKISKRAKNRIIFSDKEEDMRGLSHYKFPQGDLYMLTNFSSETIQKVHILLNQLYPNCSYQSDK